MRIVTYNLTTSLSREKIWHHFSNPETWPNWHYGLDWVRFDGPFAEGTWGVMKPELGAPFDFCVTEITPNLSCSLVCYLPNARLLTSHIIQPMHNGKHVISFQFQIVGPLAPLFEVIMGRKLKEHLPHVMHAFGQYVQHGGASSNTHPSTLH